MTLNPADAAFAARLAKDLPDKVISQAPAHYLQEPRGAFSTPDALLARPFDTEQVAQILQCANEARVGVIPYGGGTGLVGGQVLPNGPPPILLSLERLNQCRAVYPDENVLIVEAGMTIEAVQQVAADANRLFPLSYASKGTATIGAGLAVNSGGLNVLRYGPARALCLGVEAVLADGQIYRGLKRLRKDNTGYDLRNLLIGSEGSLGVITAASLTLFPRPMRVATAFLSVKDPRAALSVLSRLRETVGEAVSACELMSATGFSFLREAFPELRFPFEKIPDWALLVEIGTGPSQDPEAALMRVFEAALEEGLVRDGVIAQSEAQRTQFWDIRERMPAANKHIGAIASHDISVPLGAISDFMEDTAPKVLALGNLRLNAFGHLGDGNLHFNLFPGLGNNKSDLLHLKPAIMRLVHDQVAKFDGAFSAEHGVGRLKVEDAERYGDPTRLLAMRAIKTALDPNGILNPGAVLRA